MKNEDLKKGQKILVECEFDSFAGANQAWVLLQGEPGLAQLDDIKPDQPKPVVPKFVADWYEEHKDKMEEELCYQIRTPIADEDETDFEYWLTETENPIQTLINMHQFGYTVKLYTVKVLGSTLFKMTSDNGTEYKLIGKNETPSESKFNGYKFEVNLTEKEIKEADERLWQFAKEVTE